MYIHAYRKKLIREFHNFVHLNLATALFLGLFMFSFVEVAGRSSVSLRVTRRICVKSSLLIHVTC